MGNTESNRSNRSMRPVSVYRHPEDHIGLNNDVNIITNENGGEPIASKLVYPNLHECNSSPSIEALSSSLDAAGSNSTTAAQTETSSLRFHEIRGKNVELSACGRVATRNEASFCDAIVFTHRPVRVYEKVYFRVVRFSSLWNGMIRFGFTSVDLGRLRIRHQVGGGGEGGGGGGGDSFNEADYDMEAPFNLPKYVYPTLTNKKGYWAGALGNEALLKERNNDVFYFFVNFEGEIHYGVNHKWRGKFLDGVEIYNSSSSMQPLWAMFDVYGNTLGIELIDADYDLNLNQTSVLNQNMGPGADSGLGSSTNSVNNMRTMSSLALGSSSRSAVTPAPASASSSDEGTLNNSSSNINPVVSSSLGNSIGSSSSSSSSTPSSHASSSSSSGVWANSIMTTMIPVNFSNNINNNNIHRQQQSNQVVMRQKHNTSQTNRVAHVIETTNLLNEQHHHQQQQQQHQLDRVLISCRRLCVDNHLNQTLHSSILVEERAMTSSPQQQPATIDARIKDFYESVPILVHDSTHVRRCAYKFISNVRGKNVDVCAPDCLVAYRPAVGNHERLQKSATPTQNAYVFVNEPIGKGQSVCIQIVGVDQSAHESAGSLAVGCTTCPPAQLNPLLDLPDDADELLDRQEYWVVMKNVFNSNVVSRRHQIALADELCFHLDESSGNVNMLINGQMIVECLFNVDLTQRFYFFFDLAGKTNAIRLIPECQHQQPTAIRQQQQQSQLQQEPSSSSSSPPGQSNKRRSALIDYYKSQLVCINSSTTSNESTSKTNSNKEGENSSEECRICWDAPIECVFYSCGHMCLCWNCATALKKQASASKKNNKSKPATCPICRLEIIDIIRFFKS